MAVKRGAEGGEVGEGCELAAWGDEGVCGCSKDVQAVAVGLYAGICLRNV